MKKKSPPNIVVCISPNSLIFENKTMKNDDLSGRTKNILFDLINNNL